MDSKSLLPSSHEDNSKLCLAEGHAKSMAMSTDVQETQNVSGIVKDAPSQKANISTAKLDTTKAAYLSLIEGV